MDKVISMKEAHDSEQITWLPLNRPPIGTAVIVFCKGCKVAYTLYMMKTPTKLDGGGATIKTDHTQLEIDPSYSRTTKEKENSFIF